MQILIIFEILGALIFNEQCKIKQEHVPITVQENNKN